jgi:propanol-preferring alcohol dehydrogenase
MTRQDGRDFVVLAAKIGIRPRTTTFRLEEVNDALLAVANDAIDGAAVVIP